jgi:hypothetical protein
MSVGHGPTHPVLTTEPAALVLVLNEMVRVRVLESTELGTYLEHKRRI